MGTPDFAIPSLEMLIDKYNVVGVVTRADRPKGRGHKLSAPPVKELAMKHGIEVLQPEKLKTEEFYTALKAFEPELLITAAYGKIIPADILALPKLGCINVHGSLLPKYRGAAPIHWAIINGETKTGITTMFTELELDTGDMLIKNEIEISPDVTVGELYCQMAQLGAETLRETLVKLEEGSLERHPQNHQEATYAPMINKELSKIDFTKTSKQVHDLIRGTNPCPGAHTLYKGDRMRVWATEILDAVNYKKAPGMILAVESRGIEVACGEGAVLITEVQFDSCRRMCVDDYICGHKIDEGEILG